MDLTSHLENTDCFSLVTFLCLPVQGINTSSRYGVMLLGRSACRTGMKVNDSNMFYKSFYNFQFRGLLLLSP